MTHQLKTTRLLKKMWIDASTEDHKILKKMWIDASTEDQTLLKIMWTDALRHIKITTYREEEIGASPMDRGH